MSIERPIEPIDAKVKAADILERTQKIGWGLFVGLLDTSEEMFFSHPSSIKANHKLQ